MKSCIDLKITCVKGSIGIETRMTMAEPKILENFQDKAKRMLDLRSE